MRADTPVWTPKFKPAVALLAVGALLSAGPAYGEGTQVLTAARLYPAPDQAPIDDAVVLVRDGRIVAVGPHGQVEIPEAATRLEGCDGGVLVAGFQNSHVHFTEPKFSEAATQPADQLAEHLASMLTRYGFTTVVDAASALDNTLALRARVERGEVPGPRILTAGLPLYHVSFTAQCNQRIYLHCPSRRNPASQQRGQ